MTDERYLDAASLKALAHPLRARLHRELRDGPATSAQLARRLGQNTGTVSWHLRHLARYGFIEDDPGHDDARERWWRVVEGGVTLDIRRDGLADDPGAVAAARWYAHDGAAALADDVQRWIASSMDWPEDWMGASVLHQSTTEVTAAQLAALQRELHEVIERHRIPPGANDDPTARRVRIGLQLLPLGEPPAAGEGAP